MGRSDRGFQFILNTGSVTQHALEQINRTDNPLDGVIVNKHSAPACADLDSDEDFDLVLDGQ